MSDNSKSNNKKITGDEKHNSNMLGDNKLNNQNDTNNTKTVESNKLGISDKSKGDDKNTKWNGKYATNSSGDSKLINDKTLDTTDKKDLNKNNTVLTILKRPKFICKENGFIYSIDIPGYLCYNKVFVLY